MTIEKTILMSEYISKGLKKDFGEQIRPDMIDFETPHKLCW